MGLPAFEAPPDDYKLTLIFDSAEARTAYVEAQSWPKPNNVNGKAWSLRLPLRETEFNQYVEEEPDQQAPVEQEPEG